MIVFDLHCRGGDHRFEGWFASSEAFAHQAQRGLVSCPVCGGADIAKALMAPNIARKGNQLAPQPKPEQTAVAGGKMSPEAVKAMQMLATMQAQALKGSRYVGDSFAEESRAQFYGEREAETIHGQASAKQARELFEEGIAVLPLPFPVAPPDKTN